MRLDRVFIDRFRNLRNLEVSFSARDLATVLIGRNGSGKSNLFEAITEVFRSVDFGREQTQFSYEIDYRIDQHSVRLTNLRGEPSIFVDERKLSRPEFERNKSKFFPGLIFGYYSGANMRFERLFDSHQRRYLDSIKGEFDVQNCRRALEERRLFYCRPIHGAFALLTMLAYADAEAMQFLYNELRIREFHSAIAILKEPSFAIGSRASRVADARDIWGIQGLVGSCARNVRDVSFYPLTFVNSDVDDYREDKKSRVHLACFLRNKTALADFAQQYSNEKEMFAALDAVDICGMIRDLYIWVTRESEVGELSFSDLSEGEQQLLMVLILMRISRGQHTLFLLDEPDTHLNPMWQYTYLDLMKRWTGTAAGAEECQILIATHNPVVVGGLRKEQVRIINVNANHAVAAEPEYDPIGIGIEGLLKSELFGLRSSLAQPILDKLDQHYALLGKKDRSATENEQLKTLSIELNELGVSRTHPNPYFEAFATALARSHGSTKSVLLSKEEIDAQALLADQILKQIIAEEAPAAGERG